MTDPSRLEASYQFCRRVARASGSNFYPCFVLLRRPKRRAMDALYAFLRHTDDLSDSAEPVQVRREELACWRTDLDAALAAGEGGQKGSGGVFHVGDKESRRSGDSSADMEDDSRPLAGRALLPAVADTVRRYGAVFQTSTEDRSIGIYHRMAELVRNGRLGRLQRIRVTLPAGPGDPGDPTPQPVPDGFDYDLWLGPAPWAPYCAGRIHWNFRWIVDYSGGQLTDWGAHLLDTAQWANDTERTGPVEVEGTGKCHDRGLYDTFHEYHLKYRYASGVELLIDSGGTGIRFEGTDGWVQSGSWCQPIEASSRAILESRIGPEEIRLFTCPAGEHRNFLDCVKSRRDPYFPAEIGHRCSTVAHIGNIAMWTGRRLQWDPAAERFVGDEDANRYLSRAMRAPWSL